MPKTKEDPPKMAVCRRIVKPPQPKPPGFSPVEQALTRLNRERMRLELNHGAVETIIVFDGHRKVNCYGRYLDAQFIFGNFNLNCTVRGTRTTCQISYPSGPAVSPSYRRGFLVRASDLGITVNPSDPDEDFYLAIVNLKSAGDCDFVINHYRLELEDEA
jgi:hypothetical protein